MLFRSGPRPGRVRRDPAGRWASRGVGVLGAGFSDDAAAARRRTVAARGHWRLGRDPARGEPPETPTDSDPSPAPAKHPCGPGGDFPPSGIGEPPSPGLPPAGPADADSSPRPKRPRRRGAGRAACPGRSEPLGPGAAAAAAPPPPPPAPAPDGEGATAAPPRRQPIDSTRERARGTARARTPRLSDRPETTDRTAPVQRERCRAVCAAGPRARTAPSPTGRTAPSSYK